MNVDVHAHIIPREVLNQLESLGPQLLMESDGFAYLRMGNSKAGPLHTGVLSIPDRIKYLDGNNIDIQTVSITHHLFLYKMDVKVALRIAQIQNDGIAKAVREHPDRLIGNAALPLQDVEVAVRELDRAVHDCELRGVEIGTNIAGKNLDDRSLWPLYEKLEAYDIPLFVHPNDVAGGERLQKYYLWNIIGNPAETSIAISSVIFGGVLEEFPRLRFLFSHGGGFIPYQIGRIEHGFRVRPECAGVIKRSTFEYLRMLYFDTILFNEHALQYLISVVGADRIMMGTDYPFNMGEWNPVRTLEGTKIPETNRRKILGENAAKFFKV